MRFERRAGESNLLAILGGGIVLAGLAGLAWTRLGLPIPRCALRSWTGVPCPTCGTVRLLDAIAEGDLARAATSNPLVFGALALGVVSALAGLAGVRLLLDRAERRRAAAGAALAILLGWGYVVSRGG